MVFGDFHIGGFFLGEVLDVHVWLDSTIHEKLNIKETGLSDRIDNAITLGFTLVAFAASVTFRLRPAAPAVRLAFVSGFAFIFSASILDFLSNRPDFLLLALNENTFAFTLSDYMNFIEEAFENIAASWFLIGLIEYARHPNGQELRESVP
jgi:hypothetical protein